MFTLSHLLPLPCGILHHRRLILGRTSQRRAHGGTPDGPRTCAIHFHSQCIHGWRPRAGGHGGHGPFQQEKAPGRAMHVLLARQSRLPRRDGRCRGDAAAAARGAPNRVAALLAKVGRVRPQHADFVVVRAVQAVRSPFRHGLDEHAHVELVWVVVAHNLVDIMRGGSRVGKRGRVHENDPGRFAAPGKRQRGRGAEVARTDDEVRGHGGQPALVATGPLGCCDDGLRVSAVGQMCCRFGFPYYLFFHFSEPEVADSECDEENQGRPRQMGAKASRSMRVAGGVSQQGLAAGGVLNGGYGNDDVKVGGKVQVNGDGKGGLGSDKTCIPLLGRA